MPRCRAISFDNEIDARAAARQTADSHGGEVQSILTSRHDTTPVGYQARVNVGTAKEPEWYVLLTARWGREVGRNAKSKS